METESEQTDTGRSEDADGPEPAREGGEGGGSAVDRLRADLLVAWAEHRRYVGFSAVLFLLGIPVGVLLSLEGFDLAAALGLEGIEELFGEDVELTVRFLLTNNTQVFVLMVAGALTAGLLTVFALAFNGFVVGYVVTPIAADEGVLFVFVGLAPHGVPELFAFFVAGGVGFRLVVCVVERVRGTREVVLGRDGWRRVAILLVAAWLLLAVAAVIEAHVTAALLDLLF